MGGGGYQYPISLKVNRKVSHIPFSKLENIPLIKFARYPISLEVKWQISCIPRTPIQSSKVTLRPAAVQLSPNLMKSNTHYFTMHFH